MIRAGLAVIVLLGCAIVTLPVAVWASCHVERDIVYRQGAGQADRLDLYLHPGSRNRPILVYFHGGGWVPGQNKEDVRIWHLPFLYLGWDVANVEYRRADVAPAPAAVEDAVCAVRWIAANAALYHLDTGRIVLMGDSAGGHLALMAGMAPDSAGFGRACPGTTTPRAAAIVAWAGATDVSAILEGPEARGFARSWIGDRPDGSERARSVSPVTFVRPGLPPVFLAHSAGDPVVPYTQALALRDGLNRAGVDNRLVTIPGERHTQTGMAVTARIYVMVLRFLYDEGVRLLP
jgi:acetyl esterase/lipase